MPYSREWDPNVTQRCPPRTWFNEVVGKDDKGYPIMQMVEHPCPDCDGTGQRKVGGWVQVWIEPPPPTTNKR